MGQSPKPKKEPDYVIATLFKGVNGVRNFDMIQRMESPPGFPGLKLSQTELRQSRSKVIARPRIITIE